MGDRLWRLATASFLLVSLVTSTPAFAYIGPGVAAGAVASALGVLGSIVLGLFSVIYYPIKRVLKKRKKGKRLGAEAGPPE